MERGDGLASAKSRSKIAPFAPSAAPGSASTPLSSITRMGRGPTLPYAMRVTPAASTPQQSVTDARSWPRRRVRRTWVAPIARSGSGSSIAVTSSPRARVVTPDRTKNPSIGMRRVPAGPTATTRAPWTRSAGAVSAAGEALHTFPARVARLRIWTDPTTAAASARAGYWLRMRSSATMSVITVPAPMTMQPASSRMEGRISAIRLMSITTPGRAEPSRSRMIRSVPPARTRASAPCWSSRATASASCVGRAYANVCISRDLPRSEDPFHLVQEHLRGGRPDEVEGALTEAADEVRSPRAKGVVVHHRHDVAGSQQLVGQEVVLQRVEELELALERDELVRGRV